MTRIRIIRDHEPEGSIFDPVAPGTIIENAYIANEKDALVEAGEAWYQHPENGLSWFSAKGDFEVVR